MSGGTPLSAGRVDTVRLALVKSVFAFAGRLLSVPSTLVVAQVLGPFNLGLLAIARLLQQYVSYAHFGLLDALVRNVPIARGRGDEAEGRSITDIVFTGHVASTLLGAGVIVALYAAGIRFNGLLDGTRLALLLVAILTGAALTFLRDYSKAEGELMVIAKVDAVLVLMLPLVTIPLTMMWGLTGALATVGVTNAVALARYARLLPPLRVRLRIEVRRTLALVGTGIPVFVNKVSDTLFWSVDLLVITVLMTPADVGVYNLALSALLIVTPFLGGINQTVYFKIMRDTGAHGGGDPRRYVRYAEAPLVCYMLATSLALGAVTLAWMLVARLVLPAYAASVEPLVILGGGYVIYSSMLFMKYYLDATSQLLRRFPIIAGAFAVNAALDAGAIALGYGLVGVAWASASTFAMTALVVLFMCFNQIYGSYRPALSFMARTVMVAGGGATFLAFARQPLLGGADSVVAEWVWGIGDLAIKLLVYTAVCVAGYLVCFRRYRIETELLPLLRYARDAMARAARRRQPLAEGSGA